MSNRIKKFSLGLVYIAVILFIGCVPEDSLEWSDDGSVGLLRVKGALYLVDGETGELTEIATDSVLPWPDISKDGSLIAYSRVINCDNLSEGLEMLPAEQAKMIKYYAGQMAKDIISKGGLIDKKFPEPPVDILKHNDVKEWVIRFLCQNADDELTDALGEEGMKLGKGKELEYSQVIVVSKNNLNDKRVITTSIFPIMAIRLSPDKQNVAYIMNTQHGEEEMEYSLYVASLNGEVKSMFVDDYVALGYDWSEDSERIVFLSSDSSDLDEDMVLGTLNEIEVADALIGLLSKQHEINEAGAIHAYDCSNGSHSLAGTVFYPWMKVRYGIGGRIFFSTVNLPLPTSNMDEPGYSVFCYDPVIKTVTDIMPPKASAYASQSMCMLQFELSQDSKIIMVPFKENRFLGFILGTDEIEVPFSEDEAFGDEDISYLIPGFKGQNEISFLVSEDNHYLIEAGRAPEDCNRSEIIVLNHSNNEVRILSESWPDEIIEALVKN